MPYKKFFASTLIVLAAFLPHAARSLEPDSLVVAPLRKERAERDCSTTATNGCRVVRNYSASEIRKRLDAKTNVWRDGDALTFAVGVEAESVDLSGGIQYPMSRLAGTDIWVVTIRIKDIERAIVSYFFVPQGPGIKMPERFSAETWRGPEAPAAPAGSSTLKGRITVDTLSSRYLSEPRAIVVYEPPARGNEPIAGVVYLGDGGSVKSLAPLIDTLITGGTMQRILLVGIPSGQANAGSSPGEDFRAMEYLWGFEESNRHFLAHENFILNEVIPRAESRYGAPRDRLRRATWGISNSAAWAIEMGVRHPDVIDNVLAFSPGGSHGKLRADMKFAPRVRFFLQGGTLEPPFHSNAMAWSDSLRSKGAATEFHEVIAGHDWEVWKQRFPEAVMWAFTKPSDAMTASNGN